MFAAGAGDLFSLGSSLGRSDSEWYREAKEEVAEFDDLAARTSRIANKPVREQIAKDFMGNPSDENSGTYRRNSVATNITEAEQYTPVNTLVFGQARVQNRVQKLKDINSGFKAEVMAAETTWGSLPSAQVIESVKTVQTSTVPGWVAPVVIGAIGVAALSAFGVFGGK
jgi:hypothetical protein